MKFYAVFDKKVEAFLPPYPARARGEAIRLAEDAALNPQGQFLNHLEDYLLYEMFEWSEQNGHVVQDVKTHPVMLCPFMDFKQT